MVKFLNILELKLLKYSNQQKHHKVFFSEMVLSKNKVYNLAGPIELVNHNCTEYNAQ